MQPPLSEGCKSGTGAPLPCSSLRRVNDEVSTLNWETRATLVATPGMSERQGESAVQMNDMKTGIHSEIVRTEVAHTLLSLEASPLGGRSRPPTPHSPPETEQHRCSVLFFVHTRFVRVRAVND